MRKLSTHIVRNLVPPADEALLVPSIGRVLSELRGRPVRLREAAFPPATASGLWIDRASHDLIVYEENTDPEHQLVIIGHEAWHMFQGHGRSGHDHGPAATRSGGPPAGRALAEFVARVADADGSELPQAERTDIAIHLASRADTPEAREEEEAEHFGIRFATDVKAALAGACGATDPQNLAGRIQSSMAHRFPRA
ncbi:toxin-antitoxin system, toxin component [Streptomyces sp. NPDC091371]|uniref:toxin-antitoxin system, toxin component n=1 Tax=Streptomyces sp. NPDC091371 TaxID=3155303 RepID=UPI003442F960